MKISLFIPTYNAVTECSDKFYRTLKIVEEANLAEVLVIDSSSTDDTVKLIKEEFNFKCHIIAKADFDHGGTRQLALEMLKDSDIVIYLTQDVLLASVDSLHNLVKVLMDNEKVAGCYGKQLPHDNADAFAQHLRRFNYGNTSYTRSYADRYVWGMRCIFSSDSFAAYKVKALDAIGGFPNHVIFGEDTYVFAKLLQNGYKVAYSAEAICYHSHNYSIKQEFQRYFDIGVFHRSENWIFQDFGTASKAGMKFILSELKFLTRKPWLWPKSFFKLWVKYIGYKLGYNYDVIGVRLCRRFTMNESFWW